MTEKKKKSSKAKIKIFDVEYKKIRARLRNPLFNAAMNDFPEGSVTQVIGEFMSGLNEMAKNLKGMT